LPEPLLHETAVEYNPVRPTIKPIGSKKLPKGFSIKLELTRQEMFWRAKVLLSIKTHFGSFRDFGKSELLFWNLLKANPEK